MKRFLLALIFLLSPASLLAADSTILALPETTTPVATDMMYIVTDPSGAATDNKISIDTLMGLAPAETDPIRNVTGLNSFANAMCWGDGDDKWCIYVSGGATPKLVPVCNNVENDCDHVIQLKTGKKFSITNNAGTEIASITEAGVPFGFTNRTIEFAVDDTAANDTDYMIHGTAWTSTGAPSPTLTTRAIIGAAGRITEMYCKITTAPTSTNTVIFTAVTATTPASGTMTDSSMTFTITGANVQGSTTANPVTVAKGDFVGIKKVDSASAIPSDETVCFLNFEE